MNHVYENMTHYLNPDDKIAGYWTEYFIGFPIDIERGVFNGVFQAELKWSKLAKYRLKSILKTVGFLIRKRELRNFIKNTKIMRSMGTQPINLGIKTMDKREINPYSIDKIDMKILLKKLLPKWKGKSLIEILEKEIKESGLLSEVMVDFLKSFPAASSKQVILTSMCATISTYQGHLIMDFEGVLKKGILGLKDDVINELNKPNLNEEEIKFLHSLEIALDGIIIYIKRLCEKLEKELSSEKNEGRKINLQKILDNCRRVPLYPPETFYQAVQSAWIIKVATELVHPVNLHSFGRMDQIFYPYYEKDLKEGKITQDEARELLAELLLKVMSLNIRPESNTIGNFYHRYLGSSPITIGGIKPDGTDGTNDLTYLFLEAAELSRAVTNISLRVNNETPDKVLFSAAETLYKGSSNLSIFNDEVNIEAMKRRGHDEEDARDYAVMGCVEMLCPSKTGGMSANALLLCRLLDLTLRNGDAQTLFGSMKGDGIKTGNPNNFKTFEELTNAFIIQGKAQIKLLVELSNLKDRLYAEILPAPFISVFIDGCIKSRRDVTRGGGKYDLSGISFINSIANLTDSLYVIKKLIFDEKSLTFTELIDAIDNNFIGHVDLIRKINRIEGKWGNGYDEVDELARNISSQLFEDTYNYKSYRGGVFVPYVISMTTHTIDGRISIATADGRRAATPYAASCNPYNVERNGITNVFKSVAALDFEDVLGCAVNIKLHPTAIGRTKELRQKWITLIRTYFELGGAQLQPTVTSAEILQAAQENPKQYSDIIVKVGGYSAYFTELGIEIQNEVIQRTQH